MVGLFAAAADYLEPLSRPRGVIIGVATFCGLSLIIAASFARTMIRLRLLTVLSNGFLLLSATVSPNPQRSLYT